MEVIFNNIEEEITKKLRQCNNVYGCMSWFTNQNLINELGRLDFFKILVNDDEINRKHISEYQQASARVNNKEIYNNPSDFKLAIQHDCCIMHNKIMVLRRGRNILCTIAGSYNWTNRANNNFENITICYDNRLNQLYLEEVKRIHKFYVRNALYTLVRG